MQTLVIYDITDDRVRGRIADVCLDYGLERTQFSAFLGDLNGNRREEMQRRLARFLGKKEGNLQVFVICDRDLSMRWQLINGPPSEKDREARHGTGPEDEAAAAGE